MAARRHYSHEERAAALAALDANGGNESETARELGIPRVTLLGWAKHRGEPERVGVVEQLRQIKRPALADRLEELAHKLIDLMPEAAAQAPANHLAVSLGIAIDKMRLLREQPTERIADDRLTHEERADRVLQLLGARGTGNVGQPAPEPTLN